MESRSVVYFRPVVQISIKAPKLVHIYIKAFQTVVGMEQLKVGPYSASANIFQNGHHFTVSRLFLPNGVAREGARNTFWEVALFIKN